MLLYYRLAYFVTLSVKTVLHYRLEILLHYRSIITLSVGQATDNVIIYYIIDRYYIIGQLLHYRL